MEMIGGMLTLSQQKRKTISYFRCVAILARSRDNDRKSCSQLTRQAYQPRQKGYYIENRK